LRNQFCFLWINILHLLLARLDPSVGRGEMREENAKSVINEDESTKEHFMREGTRISMCPPTPTPAK
jgi:hypothetical protein